MHTDAKTGAITHTKRDPATINKDGNATRTGATQSVHRIPEAPAALRLVRRITVKRGARFDREIKST